MSAKTQARRRSPAPARKANAMTIDGYLAQVAPGSRELLEGLRRTIHELVPEVEECISYRIPAFRLPGGIVAGFAATAKGGSYYPFSGSTLPALSSKLDGFTRTPSALHFTKERPLTKTLVRQLLQTRLKELKRV